MFSRLRSPGKQARGAASQRPAAILFGSMGTLVETSEMQRQAFNDAFAEAGLDWDWDVETYRRLLERPGGQARIERYAAERGESVDAAALHRRKTALFDREIEEGALELRPGVLDVLDMARDVEIPVGLATSTSRENLDVMFSATTGQLTEERFAFVGDASMAARPKPAPDIYLAALKALGIGAAECIVIEDTLACFEASRAAGIHAIAFPNENAARGGYDGALAQVDRLAPEHFTVPE